MDIKLKEESSYFEKSQEIFDYAYSKMEKFLYKSKDENKIEFNNLKINGKTLFIDGREKTEGKINSFWHLASQNKDELKYDMYPCENTELKKFCIPKCVFDREENFLNEMNRVPCIYRAKKMDYFFDIINLYNINPSDPRLKSWYSIGKDGKHFHIRFIDSEKDIDYIIIFKVMYTYGKTDISQYRLITAFPIIMKSYKEKYDRDYKNNFIKK